MAKDKKKVCALPGCEVKFVPKKSTQIYCEPKHAQKAANDRRYAQASTGDEALDSVIEQAQVRDDQLELARQLRQLSAEEAKRRRYEDILERSVKAYEPTPLVRPTSTGKDLSYHEWILLLSDWHVGQRTRLEETGGIYEQDIATTRAQVGQIWEAVSRLHEIESSGRKIPVCHVLSLGDLIENDDMRPSQHRKVEEVMTVQTVQAFDLFVWTIRQLLTIFERVEVDMVGGNHDRSSRNRGDAGLGELDYIDTMSWLIGAFAERVLAADIEAGRLKLRNWETFFGYKDVLGQKVVFEHGSSFKWGVGSYGGVPWYGIQSAGMKYKDMLGGADIVALGHGHKWALLPNGHGQIVVNGALPATSTFAQAGFKQVSRPQQSMVSVHKRIGFTTWMPLYADVPGQLKPGMVWTDPEGFAEGAISGRAAVHHPGS